VSITVAQGMTLALKMPLAIAGGGFVVLMIAVWRGALGIGTVGLVAGRVGRSDRAVSALLALLWLWTGIAYHWLFFARINKAAVFFGALCVAEAALLIWLATLMSVGPLEETRAQHFLEQNLAAGGHRHCEDQAHNTGRRATEK
jgi:hypothetical protein